MQFWDEIWVVGVCSDDEPNEYEVLEGKRVVRLPLNEEGAHTLLQFCYGNLECQDPDIFVSKVLQLARLPRVKVRLFSLFEHSSCRANGKSKVAPSHWSLTLSSS